MSPLKEGKQIENLYSRALLFPNNNGSSFKNSLGKKATKKGKSLRNLCMVLFKGINYCDMTDFLEIDF